MHWRRIRAEPVLNLQGGMKCLLMLQMAPYTVKDGGYYLGKENVLRRGFTEYRRNGCFV